MGWKKKTGLMVASFFGIIIVLSIMTVAIPAGIEQQKERQPDPYYWTGPPPEPGTMAYLEQEARSELIGRIANCQEGYGAPCGPDLP